MSKQEKQPVYALTSNNEGIAKSVITLVEVTNILSQSKDKIATRGIWDTGATASVVTKSTATALGLIPVRQTIVRGVHGNKEVNVYFVNITLNNKNITLNTQVTECDELSTDNSVGMLIGMNIIAMGDFAITNFQGQTTMSFRVPSLQKIDFVKGMKSAQQIVKDKFSGQNDPALVG
ncbi:hypothetical protein SAMD00024442_146_2 [Candidatus Symbiothrix dinenymphae]|nr:hypothetical protein SAMD00024442_146_2 [Candidatus Symbiothrix dinenymphae]